MVQVVGYEKFQEAVCVRMDQGYVPAGGVTAFPAKSSPLAGSATSIAYVQAMVLLLEPEEEIAGEGVSVEIPGVPEA